MKTAVSEPEHDDPRPAPAQATHRRAAVAKPVKHLLHVDNVDQSACKLILTEYHKESLLSLACRKGNTRICKQGRMDRCFTWRRAGPARPEMN